MKCLRRAPPCRRNEGPGWNVFRQVGEEDDASSGRRLLYARAKCLAWQYFPEFHFWDEARQNMVIQGMFCLLERERDVQTTVVHDVNVAAPETLLKGGAYDSRAEVYSLASCFYFLITGEPLIRGDQRFCSAHQTGLASDRHLQSRYSSGFLKSLDRALQVRREDRFASASVWINELKRGHDTAGKDVVCRREAVLRPFP